MAGLPFLYEEKKKRGTASCKYILEGSKGSHQTKLPTAIFNLSTSLFVH